MRDCFRRIAITFVAGAVGVPAVGVAKAFHVGLDQPLSSLADAVKNARDGDELFVHGGSYPGPLEINRTLVLHAENGATIDGHGKGTVVKITAPEVHFEGFEVTDSGDALDQENSGIAVEAPGAVIRNNHLRETLFGIYLRQADNSVIVGNRIESKNLRLPRRGDPIRIWYSNNVRVEKNRVHKGRDLVLWYSSRLTIRDNIVTHGRYGLHFMYCDDAVVEDNRLSWNSVGAFLMYSRRLSLHRNIFAHNRGASGYGIGLKDMDDPVLESNLFADNRVGIYIDNSPRELTSTVQIRRNLIVYNDIGIHVLPSVQRNTFANNAFVENLEQVRKKRGGETDDNDWHQNYWSDYAGYDLDGDGFGELPYKSDRFFEDLMDRHPMFRMFLYSPSVQALEWATRLLPAVKPEPKLVDARPRTERPSMAGIPVQKAVSPWPMRWTSLALLGIAGLAASFPRWRPNALHQAANNSVPEGECPAIDCRNVTKSFGRFHALRDFSLGVKFGECVALWGANGAGKTTALRCVLGVFPFTGEIRVAGKNPAVDGKAVREVTGYIPQSAALYDELTVEETLDFFCDIRGLDHDRIGPVMRRVAIEDHALKPVKALSGGLKQRLTLGIAMLADPPILLFDEPTASLDAASRRSFLELLQSLKREGRAVLFASHRIEEVKALADRVIILDGGQQTREGRGRDIESLLGLQTSITVALPSSAVPETLDLLAHHGMEAVRENGGIRLTVPPTRRLAAIELLVKDSRLPVDDLVVEVSSDS